MQVKLFGKSQKDTTQFNTAYILNPTFSLLSFKTDDDRVSWQITPHFLTLVTRQQETLLFTLTTSTETFLYRRTLSSMTTMDM